VHPLVEPYSNPAGASLSIPPHDHAWGLLRWLR
jgi:hypothetical protein